MKVTQKRAVFYVLWESHIKTPEEYVPAWRFTGEIRINELNVWYFMSYKCPANGVSIYFENPNLIERRMTTGRSGAKYYEYRLKDPINEENIQDESIRKFYDEIKPNDYESQKAPQGATVEV